MYIFIEFISIYNFQIAYHCVPNDFSEIYFDCSDDRNRNVNSCGETSRGTRVYRSWIRCRCIVCCKMEQASRKWESKWMEMNCYMMRERGNSSVKQKQSRTGEFHLRLIFFGWRTGAEEFSEYTGKLRCIVFPRIQQPLCTHNGIDYESLGETSNETDTSSSRVSDNECSVNWESECERRMTEFSHSFKWKIYQNTMKFVEIKGNHHFIDFLRLIVFCVCHSRSCDSPSFQFPQNLGTIQSINPQRQTFS